MPPSGALPLGSAANACPCPTSPENPGPESPRPRSSNAKRPGAYAAVQQWQPFRTMRLQGEPAPLDPAISSLASAKGSGAAAEGGQNDVWILKPGMSAKSLRFSVQSSASRVIAQAAMARSTSRDRDRRWDRDIRAAKIASSALNRTAFSEGNNASCKASSGADLGPRRHSKRTSDGISMRIPLSRFERRATPGRCGPVRAFTRTEGSRRIIPRV